MTGTDVTSPTRPYIFLSVSSENFRPNGSLPLTPPGKPCKPQVPILPNGQDIRHGFPAAQLHVDHRVHDSSVPSLRIR